MQAFESLAVYVSLILDPVACKDDNFYHPWDILDLDIFPLFALIRKLISIHDITEPQGDYLSTKVAAQWDTVLLHELLLSARKEFSEGYCFELQL